MGLEGKNVLITGGAKGIGRGIASAFAANGANVGICYKSSKKAADELVVELSARYKNSRFIAVFADLDSLSGAEDAVLDFTREFFKIDVLVNNAGRELYKLFVDCTERDIDDSVTANLLSAMYMTRAALPHIAMGGSIVNIASIWGLAGAAMESVYSAAKAGLIGFTKAIAKEYASRDITVNCVLPGFVEGTDMAKTFSETEILEIKNKTPLGRLTQVEDVAATTFFLASARAITGVALTVDGGFIL